MTRLSKRAATINDWNAAQQDLTIFDLVKQNSFFLAIFFPSAIFFCTNGLHFSALIQSVRCCIFWLEDKKNADKCALHEQTSNHVQKRNAHKCKFEVCIILIQIQVLDDRILYNHLEANHSQNRGLPLFFLTDSYPLSDLSQTSCACALMV